MKFKAVLFDLDGTLLDTLTDIANSMNACLRKRGFAIHPVSAYRYFVGDGMKNLVRRVLPKNSCTNELIEECLLAVKAEYGKRWDETTKPYTGVTELLEGLNERGLKKTILSNKPNDMTRITVDKLLDRFNFDKVYGIMDGGLPKPDTTLAFRIADELKIKPAEFLYLGDTNTDMLTANRAGMYPVGALWGFRDAPELIASGAKQIAKKPQNVLDIIDTAR